MATAWKILLDAGVPDGAARPVPARVDLRRVAEAIRDVAREAAAIEPCQVEPLLAWLRAWRHHWPASFAATPGVDGEKLIALLGRRSFDPGRYLKLRRIAVENLAGLL